MPHARSNRFALVLIGLAPLAAIGGYLAAGHAATVPTTNSSPTTGPAAGQSVIPEGLPVYYVDSVSGSDTNDGSKAHPWKTARVIDRGAVVLAAGETFTTPANGLSFSGHNGAWVGSADPAKPAILSGEYLTQWNTTTTGCTLANVTLTSPDGKGFGGNVRGSNCTFTNINFGNLAEGLDYVGPCVGWTITDGKQLGNVRGRCHYFLDMTKLRWTGGFFGPAQTQSPIRFSSPGVRDSVITNVTATELGAPANYRIASWAIHCASNVQWINCSALYGEFSFNGAGAGLNDLVQNCTITDLHVINTKLTLDNAIPVHCHFVHPICVNPTGECIGLNCGANAGNTIDRAELTSPKHGIHCYTKNDTVITNTTLTAPTTDVPVIDGLTQPMNDGGGNKVVTPVETRAYFVSPAGDDTNTGRSITEPLKTIDRALTVDTTGLPILIRGGVYREQPNVWPSDSGVSIEAYADPETKQREPVYINAAAVLTGTWVQDGTSSRWYLPNFSTMTAGVWVDWSGTNDGPPLRQIGTYSAGFADERAIKGAGASDMMPGTYFGDIASKRLYVWLKDGSNPNQHTLEYAANPRVIYQPGAPSAGGDFTYARGVRFVGLKLRHADAYASGGQDAGCAIYTVNDEQLIDCDIQWNCGVGVILRGTGGMTDCIASNNGRNGVNGAAAGFSISGGHFNANYWRANTDGSESGIKVMSNTPAIWGDIRNAEVAGNFGKGIWFDTCWQGKLSHITGNNIHDNQQQGIDLEASKNFVVSGNTITDNGDSGIFDNAASSVSITGNTLVGNHGVAAIELDGGARMAGTTQLGTFDVSITHNTIGANASTYAIDLPLIGQPQYDARNTSDYNTIMAPAKFTNGGAYVGPGTPANSLAAWQAESGQDLHSTTARVGPVAPANK